MSTPRGVDGVPGVGDKRKDALLAWADDFRQQFRFDPKKDVSAVERRRVIVAKFRQRQGKLRSELEREIAEIRAAAQSAVDRVDRARRELNDATSVLARARADSTMVAMRR